MERLIPHNDYSYVYKKGKWKLNIGMSWKIDAKFDKLLSQLCLSNDIHKLTPKQFVFTHQSLARYFT